MTGKTDFKIYSHNTAREIEGELHNFSKEWHTAIANDFSKLIAWNKRFTQSFFGGKMIRGTLVKLSYELTEKQTAKAIIKPAAAFEILHTSLMIHDDIIDQSPLRRGKRALHISNDNNHYGISQALCLGDIGITQSIKLLSESDFPIERRNLALNFFLQMVTDTMLGEMLDIESAQAYQRTEKHILDIYKTKTANYTIVGPLSLGAILGGASDELLKTIKLFGEYLGIAFQIQDDILGIFGDENTIGKSITSDIEENKSTLLLTYSLKQATKEQQAILKAYYGKSGITKEQHEQIKQVFHDSGALDYCKNMIIKLTSQAKELIPQLSQNDSKQELLTQFIDLLVKREK